MILMFYKVTANTELTNTKSLILRDITGLGSYELLVIAFPSTDESMVLFLLHRVLRHLIEVVDSLALNLRPAVL